MADQMDMQEDKMDAEGGAPEGEQAPEGDPIQTVKKMEEALVSLQQAIAGANPPKEVLAPLDAAVQSFGEFVSVMTGSAQAPKSAGVQNEMAMGAKGSVPADQYTGKGMKVTRA